LQRPPTPKNGPQHRPNRPSPEDFELSRRTDMTLGAADTIEQLAVNTIRTLSMDAVQAANSGHPGTPMALAPVAYKLWRDYLRFDPELPVWGHRARVESSVVGQSGSFRAFGRPRLGAAVLDVEPGRGEVGQSRLRDCRCARRVAG